MKSVSINLIGGLGNRMFQFSYAKAFAEARGMELRTSAWVGEKAFKLCSYADYRPDGGEDIKLSGYFQSQKDIDTYSRADCRRWFQFLPEVLLQLTRFQALNMPYAHFRRGDYHSAGYPTISYSSVATAVKENRGGNPDFIAVSDDFPTIDPWFKYDMQCLPDFFRLMSAPVLFRSNSSFSYWAGVLSKGDVYSPVIDGLVGGAEHSGVRYVRGNHSRLANLDFTTELNLRET